MQRVAIFLYNGFKLVEISSKYPKPKGKLKAKEEKEMLLKSTASRKTEQTEEKSEENLSKIKLLFFYLL